MFHHNLQRVREAAGYTQATFARALKVSLRTVQNWEQGHREPALEMVARIARTLGVSTDALLTAGRDDAQPPTTKKRTRK